MHSVCSVQQIRLLAVHYTAGLLISDPQLSAYIELHQRSWDVLICCLHGSSCCMSCSSHHRGVHVADQQEQPSTYRNRLIAVILRIRYLQTTRVYGIRLGAVLSSECKTY